MSEDEKDLEPGTGEGNERSEAELEGRESTTEDQREAGDTGEGGEDKLPVGVTKRISRLTAQRTKAERERDAALVRLQAYEAKEREEEARRKREEESTPEGLKAAEARQRVRQALDLGFGDGFSDEIEAERQERRQERELQKEQYALNAVSYLKRELDDHGIVYDDKSLVRWEHAVGSELQEDRELLGLYRRPTTLEKAIQTAVDRVVDGIANPILKQRGADPLKRIERNRGALLSGRAAAQSAEQPFAEDYVAPGPPKGASADEQAEYWRNHRDGMWKKLGEHRPTA